MRRVLIILVCLLVGFLIFASWLTTSESGLRWAYQQALPHLPGELKVSQLEGSVLGEIHLRGIEYQQDELSVKADEILLNWAPKSLYDAIFDIRRFYVGNLQIAMANSESAKNAAEAQPVVLPEIIIPFDLLLKNAEIDGLYFERGEQVVAISKIQLNASSRQGNVDIETFSIIAVDYFLNLDGGIQTAQNYRHDFNLNWQVKLPSTTRVDGNGRLSGDLTATRLNQHLTGPLNLTLDARLLDLVNQFNWIVKVEIDDFDSQRLDAELPPVNGAMTLQGKGDLDTASVSGTVQANTREAGLVNATYDLQRLRNNTIQINQLKLVMNETELVTRGNWKPGASSGDTSLNLKWKNLRWPLQGIAEFNSASGTGMVQGDIDNYRLKLDFEGPRPETLVSIWSVNAEGNLDGLKLNSIGIKTLDGKLEASGSVNWKPALSWDAKITASDINPAGLMPEWPGKINAALTSSGKFEANELTAVANISKLQGILRDYPVLLKSRLHWRDNGLEIEQLDFSSGDARINAKGRAAEELNLDWSLRAENMAELYPQAAGYLRATGQLTGPIEKPTVGAEFEGRGLGLPGYAIETLNGSLDINLLTPDQANLKITALGIKIQDESLRSVSIDVGKRQLKASLVSDLANAEIGLRGEFNTDSWQGSIDSIDITTRDFANWQLVKPARLDISKNRFETDSLCLLSSQMASACTSIAFEKQDWSLNFKLSELPQTFFKPWLGEGFALEGSVNASADLRLNPQHQVTGQGEIQLPAGAVGFVLPNGDPGRWTYEHAKVGLLLDRKGISVTTQIDVNDSDAIDSKIMLPMASLLSLDIQKQDIEAGVKLKLKDLGLIETVLPEISDVKGKLEISLTMDGTLGKPGLTGTARLQEAAFRLPENKQSFANLDLTAQVDASEILQFDLAADYAGGKLVARGQSTLNSDLGWPGTVIIEGRQLIMADLLGPWMPGDLKVEGELDASAELQFKALEHLFGEVNIQLPQGVLSYPGLQGEASRWEYQNARINIKLDSQGIEMNSALTTNNDGLLDASVSLPGAEILKLDINRQAIRASAKLDIRDISIIEAVVPEITDTEGEITLNLEVSGTLAKPLFDVKTQLLNARVRVPRMGIAIDQINLQGHSESFQQFDFSLSAKSGNGNLQVMGITTLDATSGWPTEINISGEDFEVSRIPEATVLVSPDLQIKLKQQRIDIKGSVHIPYAKIQPKDVSSAARVSEDAVIIGGEQPAVEKWQVYTNIRLTLGDRVNLYGFGFEGKLGGSLLLEDEPGQLTRGTGEITVREGRYRAYGQRLNVDNGRLVYTGGPLDNPGLDFQAIRKIDTVTAGLKVRGTLDKPVLELFTVPAMGQTDSLSYLLLGRPIENASGEEGATMARAALALGLVGGDRLARTIGDRFGLDEMRVESGDTGDQASLVVGRYLSPKLYVSYGVGLVEAINTLNLRYKISEKWQLQAESGESQGADLLYTIER